LAEILEQNAVHVWCLDTERLSAREVASASAVLSPEEQVRLRQLHFPEDRRDFALAHALLRHSLSLYSDTRPEDWQFEAAANGKPFVLQAANAGQKSLVFSLSHTRGLVACAIGSRLALGIDVERLNRRVDIDAIAPLCLSPSELESLKHSPEPERQARFIELWVLKEALAKATGKGLSGLKEPPGGEWHFELLRPTPRYRLAIAANCSSAKILARWTDLTLVFSQEEKCRGSFQSFSF
jgi:4'-phosphopantetheinyl transferase